MAALLFVCCIYLFICFNAGSHVTQASYIGHVVKDDPVLLIYRVKYFHVFSMKTFMDHSEINEDLKSHTKPATMNLRYKYVSQGSF